jgi:hypothetical protein
MNSVSVCLLSSFTCWCCTFIDLYLIGQGRVICDNDPIVSINKLLLCNRELSHPKVYIYKDYKTYENEISFTSQPKCITVVPCTDKAVVTLPHEGLAILICRIYI